MSKLNVVFSEVKRIEKIEVADKVFELNEIYPYGDGGGNNIDVNIDEVVCGIHVSLGEELYTVYYDSEGYELFEN
jgi:hypothetical protein